MPDPVSEVVDGVTRPNGGSLQCFGRLPNGHLMATTCQLFEEMMAYHSLGIAGKVAGKISNTQWTFRQLW